MLVEVQIILYPYGKNFSTILLNIFVLFYELIFLPTKCSQWKKKCISDMFYNTIQYFIDISPYGVF